MSIRYRLFFAFVLILASAPLLAQPETERHYRVELIVVRHLAGSSDSTPQQELRDLGEVLDLYGPVLEAETPPQSVPQSGPTLATDPPQADGPIDAGLAEPEEPLAVRVDEMSDTMREAWRRLRGSAGFRPELFRAWEQSGDQPFPELRIHDDELLFQVDPDPLLDAVPVDEHGALVFNDQTMQQQQPASAANRDGTVDNLPEVPLPDYYYRIDGTARLTRTRFLHLELDIELREPLFGLDTPAGEGAVIFSADDSVSDEGLAAIAIVDKSQKQESPGLKSGPAAEATAFRIHRIDQRRQVKTEQMQYFDGPVIGVLALITGFDVIPEENLAVGLEEGLTEDPELAE